MEVLISSVGTGGLVLVQGLARRGHGVVLIKRGGPTPVSAIR